MFNNTITITIKCCYILSGGEWFQFFPGQRMLSRLFPRYLDRSMLLICWYADMLICQYVLLCWYGAIMLIYFSQDRECRLLSRLLSALSWLRWLSVSEHQCNCDLDDCCDYYYYYYHTPLLLAFFHSAKYPKNYWGVTQDHDITANARDVHDDADYHNDYDIMI